MGYGRIACSVIGGDAYRVLNRCAHRPIAARSVAANHLTESRLPSAGGRVDL